MTRINNKSLDLNISNVGEAKRHYSSSKNDQIAEKLSGTTNLDGNIDDFQQGKTPDCVLLAQIKNMSRKTWGKKYLKDIIRPDGQGGVCITFRGSKIEQKEFHITKDEILAVRQKQKKLSYRDIKGKIHSTGEFSTGDDDILAIELAQQKAIYVTFNYIEFITGKKTVSFDIKNPDIAHDILDKAKRDFDNYITIFSFKENNKYGLKYGHAYEVIGFEKDKDNNPLIRLCNPWDTSNEIVLDYYDALVSLYSMEIIENPDKHSDWFTALDEQTSNTDVKSMQYYYKEKTVNKEISTISKIISIDDNQKRIIKLEKYLNDDNSLHINEMLRYKISEVITKMDKAEYGFGHGKNKKELISTLMNYVINQAKEKNVNPSIIDKFKEECNNELNSILYVNEKNIIKSFETIIPELFKVQPILEMPQITIVPVKK